MEDNFSRGRAHRSFGSIQSKLLAMLLLTSILSTAVVGFFGYRSGTHALREATYARVQEVGDERLKAVQDFIANQKAAVVLDSQGVGVAASDAFNAGFDELAAGPNVSGTQRGALEKYYADVYVPNLEKTSGRTADPEAFVPTLPARSRLQTYYTVPNQGDFDQAITVDDAGDGSRWSQANARYNPYFRAAAESLGLDDVLMLDGDGDVVYTAYKGVELGSNITRGEFRGGGLEKVYDEAVRSNSRDAVAVADFEEYGPSYDKPTMFIASPIGTANDLTGVLVYEVSADQINATLSGTPDAGKFKGLGTTGEAYLVGPDETLRSDSRELLEDAKEFRREAVDTGTEPAVADRMVETDTSMLLLRDRSTPAQRAADGKRGTIETTNYLGHDVLASYQPADIEGVDWSLVTTIGSDEALAPVSDFARNLLLSTAAIILLVCAASVFMARVFTVPLNKLLAGVRAVAGGRLGEQVDAGKRTDEFGDLGAAFNDMSSSLRSKQELLDAQQAENERILRGLMPEPVVKRYRGGETGISEEHQDVSVVYVDVQGFDAFTRDKPAADALDMLNAIARGFDDAAQKIGIEKVRSVGTGYVAGSGLVVKRVDHARRVVDFAIECAHAIERFNGQHGASLVLRAGIDNGDVQSGLVGRSDVVYNLWGSTVDLAFRARSASGEPGIHVTQAIKDKLGSAYSFEAAGEVSDDEGGTTPVWRVVVA